MSAQVNSGFIGALEDAIKAAIERRVAEMKVEMLKDISARLNETVASVALHVFSQVSIHDMGQHLSIHIRNRNEALR